MARKVRPDEQGWCVDASGEPIVNKGLQNVCIDESKICFIDGSSGRLFYRGYRIEDLAKYSCFEETAYLLIYGKLPTREELNNFSDHLKEERELPDSAIRILKLIPKDTNPIEVLRTVVSFLGTIDPDKHDRSREGRHRKAIRLIAKIPTIIAYTYRIRNELELISPDPTLNHAENFLYMFHGEKPSSSSAKELDLALILYAEHENNASAFAAVVIASTLSDYYSAIVGGIGALRGFLHGYAIVEAMNQFDEIRTPDNVEKWFNGNILTGRRHLIGFGHRVYKTYDPRAKIFRDRARKCAKENGGNIRKYYEIAKKLEDIALASKLTEKGIYTNVDFWSGIVFYSLGIPPAFYCTLFAMARVVGWTAHILEYIENNKIIRPRYYYNGEIEKKYIPIDKRG
ncbi:MAG: citrate/2-methylcitrate synthase [Candidatus Njordarchaeum guaymaensis]